MDARELAAINVRRMLGALADEDRVAAAVASMDDDQVTRFNTSCDEAAAERDALRARLMGDAQLRAVVCPLNTWKTAEDRFDVARSLVKLLERFAAKHEVPLEDLVAEMVKADNGIAQELAIYGDEAVSVQWGRRFYGFTWRMQDALTGAQRGEVQRLWAIEVARQEALGKKVCTRCGGAGGAAHWPGFTCFECDGRKFI